MSPPGPPFTITVQAADHLARIVENITRLDFGTGYRLDLRLQRENRVRSIYSSLAIEGNHLSLDEVSAVLDGRAVLGSAARHSGSQERARRVRAVARLESLQRR